MIDLNEEKSYPTPFAKEPLTSLLLQLLTSLQVQKHTPDTTTTFLSEYDFIVVGAGPGGSTVAGRLSENPCVSVLLLEAGKSPPMLTEVPVLHDAFLRSDLEWGYYTTPQKYSGNGFINNQMPIFSGKAIGGSSVLNHMMYVRGSRHIFDQWEADGATGWGYKDVLKYFKKSEMNMNPELVDTEYHGFDGPMTVETIRLEHPYKSAVEAAIHELGYELIDTNGQYANGFVEPQLNTRYGQRCNPPKAYLVPAENRTNLDIVKNAFVTKILIEDNQAQGVYFDFKGNTHLVRAKREVIVSAGTVNTPKLLMLSGIGPEEHLREFGIPVIADLPVGRNLQDHMNLLHYYYTENFPTFSEEISNPQNVQTYIEKRTGIFATTVFSIGFSTDNPDSSPDDLPEYEIAFLYANPQALKSSNWKPEVYKQYMEPYENKSTLVCFSTVLTPKSRGTITLQSADAYDPPLIDPNYISDPDDIVGIVEAMKKCDRLVDTVEFRNLGVKQYETLIPGCEKFAGNKDEYYTCKVKSVAMTFAHQVGTAKMGHPNDYSAVVTPELKVKGIKGLRVVDASVMPIITAGNTYNPTIMIAEKVADLINEKIECDVQNMK